MKKLQLKKETIRKLTGEQAAAILKATGHEPPQEFNQSVLHIHVLAAHVSKGVPYA